LYPPCGAGARFRRVLIKRADAKPRKNSDTYSPDPGQIDDVRAVVHLVAAISAAVARMRGMHHLSINALGCYPDTEFVSPTLSQRRDSLCSFKVLGEIMPAIMRGQPI
jgi:hypothetical protein